MYTANETKQMLKSLTEAFYDETVERLANQKQLLTIRHNLALEKQRNQIKMAFTNKYSSRTIE